jgi:hypothetical protein
VKLAVVVVALLASACLVDRKSDKLSCSTTSECAPGRICNAGYCVTGSLPADGKGDAAAVCPSVCDSCDAQGWCLVGNPGPTTFKCPPGAKCRLSCTSPAGCGQIDCTLAKQCDITCSTTAACGAITCGTGACKTACTVSGACSQIDCASSCACDVSCSGNASQCANMSCPTAPGNKFCTRNGNDGEACDSSFSPNCNHC